MFLQSFSYSTALLIYLQKWSLFALTLRAFSTCNFASPIPNFRFIRAVRLLSRVWTDFVKKKQHAPNKRCAINNGCAPNNPILRYVKNRQLGLALIFYNSIHIWTDNAVQAADGQTERQRDKWHTHTVGWQRDGHRTKLKCKNFSVRILTCVRVNISCLYNNRWLFTV